MSEVNERYTVATLRRMADVKTSALYSQRMTLHDAADLIERLQAETAKLTVACAIYELEAAGLREQLDEARKNAPITSPLPFPAIWHALHRKRGTTYWVHGYGRLQTDVPIADMTEVVVYRSEDDGSIWVRPVREFEDGRFKVLNPKGDGE